VLEEVIEILKTVMISWIGLTFGDEFLNHRALNWSNLGLYPIAKVATKSVWDILKATLPFLLLRKPLFCGNVWIGVSISWAPVTG